MKTLKILFWVNTVILTIALFIALATGDYGAAIWISLCIFLLARNWEQAKHMTWQSKLLREWKELTLKVKERADRATAQMQEATSTAFYLAMLLGIDNEITE